MADEAEDDVLELNDEIEEQEQDEPGDDDAQEDDDGSDDEEELYIGFGGDEAAPASENESSVIRELRAKVRELTADKRKLEAGQQPEKIEVGDKPTLESCEYDEERYETELDSWKDRKAKAERQTEENRKREDAQAEEWAKVHRQYEADKASLNVPNFEEAEEEISATLPESHRALLLRSGKGAALIAALHRSPDKLEALSKLDPVGAAMMVGELRSQLKMEKRQRPNVDRPVKGNAAPSGNADKQLARLEKEAARTGDRTELIRYKRELRKRA